MVIWDLTRYIDVRTRHPERSEEVVQLTLDNYQTSPKRDPAPAAVFSIYSQYDVSHCRFLPEVWEKGRAD